jgi:DNA-binding MarR family transcriptional regulator
MAADYRQRAGYQLKRAEHALRLAMDAALGDLDLTTPQYAALSALDLTPGLANVELAGACFVTPQTMTRIVRQLLDKGFVTTDGGGRGRSHRLVPSPAGREVLREAHARVLRIEARMTEDHDDPGIARSLAAWADRLGGPGASGGDV